MTIVRRNLSRIEKFTNGRDRVEYKTHGFPKWMAERARNTTGSDGSYILSITFTT